VNALLDFKKYMDKLGADFTPAKSGQNASYQLGKYLHVQVTSDQSQSEAGLIAVQLSLRKDSFYFPLGDCWNIGANGLLEKMENILREYNLQYDIVLRACW
jgi:hypothetical protein